ncbi:MAG: TonB-dependent receptor [Pyrinomonadaceae bacterium]
MILAGKRTLSLVVVIVFAAVFIVNAQDLDDVTITGKISDPNSLAIAGATITASHVDSGVERSVTTDSDGRYVIIELRPGVYKLTATAAGFGGRERVDLQTISGQSLLLDFTLTPAGVSASADVIITDEDSPIVDITRSVVGGTVGQREIEELPNTSRDALDLVFTLGGVTEEALSTRDLSNDKGGRNESAPSRSPEEVGVFALSGGAAYSNNITIDGFDNNDDRVAGIRFQPSVESIDEVQVITNQFSAEYGRASGGRVNIRTRAGTRKYRGRLFYFFSDESLNANSWSNNRRGIDRYPFQQNVPGMTFGGPIPFGYFKDKTSFYASYEYDQIFDTTITDTWIPLAQNAGFPLPTPTSNETILDFDRPLGRFVQGSDTPRHLHRFTVRGDHNFNDNHSITVGYQFGKTNDRRQFNGGNRLAESLIGKRSKTQAINFTDNYVIGSKAVNQFRFQYSTLTPEFVSTGQAENPVVLISFREPSRTSNTTLTAGSSTLGTSGRKEERFQFQDTITYVTGDHSLRFGFDVQHIDSTFIDLNDASGTFNFQDPLASTSVPQCLIDPSDPGSGRIRGGVNTFPRSCVVRYRHNFFTDSEVGNTYTGFFAQDDIRLHENLSLNLGIRYERETVVKDNNNWGPRLGLAWSPFKDRKGVVRFGAGVFYNRVLLRTVDDYQRGQNEVVFDTNRVTSSGGARDVYLRALSDGFPSALTADHPLVQQYIAAGLNDNSFFRSLDPTLKIPESYQINLGFEREIGKSIVFEANFTVNRTARLWRETNTNAPIVPDGFSDLADYLANGITTGNTRFEFAGNSAPPTRTANGVTYYNLNDQNRSTGGTSPYGRALAIAESLRPFPDFGQTERVGSLGNSWYRGLVVELRRRYRRFDSGFGGSIRAVYTLSYLEDDGIVNTSSAQIAGDFASERSRSLLDRRHRFALSGTFDTAKWLGKLRFSPILRLGSSAPFNISNGGQTADDRNLDDVNSDRPDFSGDPNDIEWRRASDPVNLDLARAFTLAPIGRAGTLVRNPGKGPVQFLFALNVSREFRLTDKMRLRPQIEFDNVFNATVFSFGSEFINYEAVSAVPTQAQLDELQEGFLVPTRAYRPRQIRLGLRFDF